MSHLQPRPLETTLHIEPFVGFRTVEYGFVAASLLGDEIEGLDEF